MMTSQQVDDLCVKVYRARLDDECKGDADRMVQKDGDRGQKQAKRALFYRPVIAATLEALGLYERPKKGPPQTKRTEEAADA